MNHDTTQGPAAPAVGTGDLGPVVAGVDGSVQARSAALWAAAEADRRRRPLHLVHASGTDNRALYASVETIEKAREAGRDLLAETAELVEERFPDLAVTKEYSSREAVTALREAAGADGTIVVGSRGLGGFGALLLGSVGLGVAARAKVPVIVVRGGDERPGDGAVVAAVRGSDDLPWARYAAREAEARKAELRLLTVWAPLAHVGTAAVLLDDIDGVARDRVRETGRLAEALRAEFPGLTVTTEVEGSRSVPGLLVEASHHADLLVLGAHRPPFGIGRSLGHVTHAVLHHAHCPVAIVPRASADTEEGAPGEAVGGTAGATPREGEE
ncbi:MULTISPECIES: universal stress protein [unclassified Streptomyces]|uniref:universal stress protein n=1 Tax=unclassified Streptomyces TaxID=2593676 RepID=UPI0008DD9553|nr:MULTISPECIES: universal stress protein [unclassified Streptomyces]OII70531.1 universal stress protein UspA [Streptomyces sp. CC77]